MTKSPLIYSMLIAMMTISAGTEAAYRPVGSTLRMCRGGCNETGTRNLVGQRSDDALVDVANGKKNAIERSPGTGKSQTIVNAFAAALADARKFCSSPKSLPC